MSGLPLRTRLGYGVGHVLNDLCSAMWFTYLLIYFHHVLLFNNTLAGVVLLIGQVADGLSTPFVGHEADRTDDLAFCSRYGRRKTWHLAGTICVLCAFPFIFLGCLGCELTSDWAQVIYFAPFVIIFQFGWAATQISHLALIPSITQDPHDRTELNAIRYGFTVMSNITVYLITWLVMGLDSSSNQGIGPEDASKFKIIVFAVLVIGSGFSFLFHFVVKEENNPEYRQICDKGNKVENEIDNEACTASTQCIVPELASSPPAHKRMASADWLKNVQFYQVALLYMGTRLFCNLTQAYIPIYLQDTLKLPEESVAYIPLVMYVAGFLTTTVMKPFNKYIGRKGSYMIGCIVGGSACIWVWFGSGDVFCHYLLYGVASMLGAGGSIMLVTSLSITADFIGPNVESGAFVYGAMSFTDKLSNGIAVMVIQHFNPCTTCCSKCEYYFRDVIFFYCGGAAALSLFSLLTLLPTKIGARTSDVTEEHARDRRVLSIDVPDHNGEVGSEENTIMSLSADSPSINNTDHRHNTDYHVNVRVRHTSTTSSSSSSNEGNA
ncbi:Major facilitator superfamily domain-containing protein 12 [Halocaridina rubra]|uniref:Major facilitator superfamily domain-containing protein 12 n=1 Tax=Halocaridina rubra TaxID=373956 RepID=A0AAN8XC48_HALRR